MANAGIDYGMGRTNIDVKTGLRWMAARHTRFTMSRRVRRYCPNPNRTKRQHRHAGV